MKTTRFSESQIFAVLKQADAGIPSKDICRQAGISHTGPSMWWMTSTARRCTSRSIPRFLVRVFEQIKAERVLPDLLRTDNGPEFLGEAFAEWARQNGMAIRYIQPGKPNQNAYIERFNRTLREELLDQYRFKNLDDLR
jgi:transposase InsO family protein